MPAKEDIKATDSRAKAIRRDGSKRIAIDFYLHVIASNATTNDADHPIRQEDPAGIISKYAGCCVPRTMTVGKAGSPMGSSTVPAWLPDHQPAIFTEGTSGNSGTIWRTVPQESGRRMASQEDDIKAVIVCQILFQQIDFNTIVRHHLATDIQISHTALTRLNRKDQH